jgi:hypothetical protein
VPSILFLKLLHNIQAQLRKATHKVPKEIFPILLVELTCNDKEKQ